MTVDHAIARIADRQSGVIAQDQLRRLGLSNAQIKRRVARGSLYLIYPGVYAVGQRAIPPRGRMLAAQLSCGPTAFLSHRSALAVVGLGPLNPRRVDVTVPRLRLRPRPGLVIHNTRDALRRGEVVLRDGVRASSVARMFVELAADETGAELERLITLALRKHLLDLASLVNAVQRYPRRPGIAKLREAVRDYQPHPDRKSGLEAAFDRLIAGTGIPEPRRNVIVEGWELDCYWPHVKLAVELDGRDYHLTARDLEKDKYKDTKLALVGIRVVRITQHRFEMEPAQIRADVAKLTAGPDPR